MRDRIRLAHGSGSRASRTLIEQEILSRFGQGPLETLPDASIIECSGVSLLFSADSFVVQPLFFPGGSIGELAVYGTVNDLAVSGALPKWLSLSLILEEGLAFSVFRRILDDVQRAATRCGVVVATGDTKVVSKGQCDGVYISTSGVGELLPGFSLGISRIFLGDKVVVSGPLGDHAMAVMSVRENLPLSRGPVSDSGPVHKLTTACLPFAEEIKVMRDPTRGGLAAVLNELLAGVDGGIVLHESSLPFSREAKAVAEMLGFDLLQAACEGRVVAVCSAAVAERLVSTWREFPEGRGAAIVGEIVAGRNSVVLSTVAGGSRLVDIPEGELLPRIC